MSKRMWIALLMCLGTSSANAGPVGSEAPAQRPELRLGESSWYLYRPLPRSPAIHDIGYIMDRLRCDLPGYALRFGESPDYTFEFRFALLRGRNDFIGPVYDMDIGATRLVFSVNF